jgi:hypothetical protein
LEAEEWRKDRKHARSTAKGYAMRRRFNPPKPKHHITERALEAARRPKCRTQAHLWGKLFFAFKKHISQSIRKGRATLRNP